MNARAADMLSTVSSRFADAMGKMRPGTHEFGIVLLPVLIYWSAAFFYDVLDMLNLPALRRFHITRKQRGRENLVSKSHVIVRVMLQHLVQVILAFIAIMLDPNQCDSKPSRGWAMTCMQFAFGMFIMDTWQFWIHRWMHVNPYLYKHFHSHHHRLLIPYAYGALYNHPLEGLLLDTVGGLITLFGANLSCSAGVWCINFATLKTVLDHCGYLFPVNPLHNCFPNGAAYHDIHHDLRCIKTNYSQPFFTHWDIIMGSYKSTKGFHITPEELDAAAADARTRATQPAAVQAPAASQPGPEEKPESRKQR